MAISERIKLPGEKPPVGLNQLPQLPNKPSFASPEVQTAPDVRQSAAVAGNSPKVTTNQTPTAPPVTAPRTPTANKMPPTPSSTPPPTATPTPGPTVSSVSTATVPTSTGAPPGVPATTPPAPAPALPVAPTPQALTGRNAAENELIQAKNEQALKVYEAAMKLNGGPNSELETARRAAETQLRNATGNRGAAGTINSSLYGEDKGRIATGEAVADAAAQQRYQEAINAANAALVKAEIAWTRANEQERKEIAEAAERREQTQRVSPPPPPEPGGVVPKEVHGPGGTFVRIGKLK